MPLSISFYTQGDDRAVFSSTTGGTSITQTDAHQWYAQHHSSQNHAYASRTILNAITTLQSLAADSVGTLHFVGHGTSNGDFVFIGSTNATNFLGTTPLTRYPYNLLQAPIASNRNDPNQRLLNEIARVLVRNGARIEMNFCWSASGALQTAIADTIKAHRRVNFRIRGTRNYFDYRVQAVQHSGNYQIRNVIGGNLPVVIH